MANKRRLPLLAPFVLALAGCTGGTVGGVYDPLEPLNRSVHEVNKALDKALLKPTSTVYGELLSADQREGLNNAADNLTLPGVVVNDLLQLQLQDAVSNTLRFAINSTFGVFGLGDPASEIGVEPRPTDFGETLHVWGLPEGPYVELPLLGPSNLRDSVGLVADVMLNPVTGWLPADRQWVLLAAEGVTMLDDRFSFGTTVDSVLHESADSYAQTRLFYSESRRFELGDSQEAEDELYDLYGEAFE